MFTGLNRVTGEDYDAILIEFLGMKTTNSSTRIAKVFLAMTIEFEPGPDLRKVTPIDQAPDAHATFQAFASLQRRASWIRFADYAHRLALARAVKQHAINGLIALDVLENILNEGPSMDYDTNESVLS
jgi:hypothetical protein